MTKTVDILAFAAHPDDAELACSGTLIKQAKMGLKTGIVDLTMGQLGTRGSAELRLKESEASSKILGISSRVNLGLDDGFFTDDKDTKIKIIQEIRRHKPQIVLCNAVSDRHPDHGRASKLVQECCFYSGLKKIETEQEAHRPKQVFTYIQDHYLKPDFIVDISEEFEQKLESIQAFSSQFFDPNNKEPNTPISGKDFLDFIESRARELGRLIGAKYGEGFQSVTPLKIEDFRALL